MSELKKRGLRRFAEYLELSPDQTNVLFGISEGIDHRPLVKPLVEAELKKGKLKCSDIARKYGLQHHQVRYIGVCMGIYKRNKHNRFRSGVELEANK